MSTGVLERDLDRRHRELSTLVEIGKALTSTLDLQEILDRIMEKVSLLLQSQAWSLLLVDEGSGDLTFAIAVSPVGGRLKGMTLKKGEGIAGWVAQHGEPLLIPDVREDPRFARKVDEKVSFETRSIVCVPVRSRERVLGVIQLVNTLHQGAFAQEDLAILQTVADFVAIAIENARNFDRVRELTVTDDLTGLFNSRHFSEILDYEFERARRYMTDLSLIFIDLDRFKGVNDNHGHLVGSRLLSEIGTLIKSRIRRVDMGIRYGGDEFVILAPATDKKGGITLAEKLRKAIRDYPFLADDGTRIHLTASFGVASFPEDARSQADLIRKADVAMYEAKGMSRDAVAAA